MNTLRKIYCRDFQKAFHIAIPFLPYRKPKFAGSVKELPEIIMRHKCTHVLIITDGGIMKLGLTRRLEKALKEAGIPYTIYDKTVANPTTVNVREALELYHKEGCDAIIGFGGGSSMDCANAILLPLVLREYGSCIDKKLHRLAIAAELADKNTPDHEAAELFIRAIEEMKERFGIVNIVKEIQETDIPKLTHYADKEANPLYPVPKLMDASELEKFYYMLMSLTSKENTSEAEK